MAVHRLLRMAHDIEEGKQISYDEGLWLLSLQSVTDIHFLLSCANMVRHFFKGSTIDVCGIVNAKSGRCSEDCRFCAQSVHYKTVITEYPLKSVDEMLHDVDYIEKCGAARCGIVTSGRCVTDDELSTISDALRRMKEKGRMGRCASLGIMNEAQLRALKEAGLEAYHHNVETAETFFSQICASHTYDERVQTVLAAKKVGLRVCCGGIFGMGESARQRVEFVCALRALDVDMVPLNFLNPIQGTPLEHMSPLPPLEILKIIALFRCMLPSKDIRICGGREVNLRTLQPFMFIAGANGSMVGNYLTTAGRNPEIDCQEIIDLGCEVSHYGHASR